MPNPSPTPITLWERAVRDGVESAILWDVKNGGQTVDPAIVDLIFIYSGADKRAQSPFMVDPKNMT